MKTRSILTPAVFVLSFGYLGLGGESITDSSYLTAGGWNDGRAEIAFYRVERDFDQYGQANPQSFLMGTYLVKHEFDRARQAKARRDAVAAVTSFKWSAFFEFESDNSYQFKHAYVVNAAQADLAPLKASFTSYDWCSNQYRELLFRPDGKAEFLMRSDDYGNSHETFESAEGAYPVALVPLLVRAMDFPGPEPREFTLLLEDGARVRVTVRLEGRDSVETPDGELEAERIRLSYDGDFQSLVARRGEREETYWRGVDPERALLAMSSPSYRFELVEKVRSSYWDENVYTRLRHVKTRP